MDIQADILVMSASADPYEATFTGKKPWLARMLAHASAVLGRG